MTSRPVLQFSLTALFILTTLSALALSALLGISRFFGISVVELLWRSLGQFIYSVPMLIVWTVGLSMAVRRLRSYRRPAIFTIIGLTGFMVTVLLVHTIQMGMIASMNSRQVSVASVGWVLCRNRCFSATHRYGVLDISSWRRFLPDDRSILFRSARTLTALIRSAGTNRSQPRSWTTTNRSASDCSRWDSEGYSPSFVW